MGQSDRLDDSLLQHPNDPIGRCYTDHHYTWHISAGTHFPSPSIDVIYHCLLSVHRLLSEPLTDDFQIKYFYVRSLSGSLFIAIFMFQRIKILTTPWRDHQTVLARTMSMNGVQTDPSHVRLTSPQATDEV